MKTSISDKLKKNQDDHMGRWRNVRKWTAKQAEGIFGASDELGVHGPVYPQPHPSDTVKVLGDFPHRGASGTDTLVVITRNRVIPYIKHYGHQGSDHPINEGVEFTDEKSLRLALEKVYGFDID